MLEERPAESNWLRRPLFPIITDVGEPIDKLVRVTLLSGEEDWIYIHIEVQGNCESGFGQRVFVCNYRLFDRYERPIASLVVLADETPNWRPDGFGYDVLGCRMSFQFPVVNSARFRKIAGSGSCAPRPVRSTRGSTGFLMRQPRMRCLPDRRCTEAIFSEIAGS